MKKNILIIMLGAAVCMPVAWAADGGAEEQTNVQAAVETDAAPADADVAVVTMPEVVQGMTPVETSCAGEGATNDNGQACVAHCVANGVGSFMALGRMVNGETGKGQDYYMMTGSYLCPTADKDADALYAHAQQEAEKLCGTQVTGDIVALSLREEGAIASVSGVVGCEQAVGGQTPVAATY